MIEGMCLPDQMAAFKSQSFWGLFSAWNLLIAYKLEVFIKSEVLCGKLRTLSIVSEVHSLSEYECAHMKTHRLPLDTSLKQSWPLWIFPALNKVEFNMIIRKFTLNFLLHDQNVPKRADEAKSKLLMKRNALASNCQSSVLAIRYQSHAESGHQNRQKISNDLSIWLSRVQSNCLLARLVCCSANAKI